ncbi:MAG: hypothetical protein Q9182_000364 [Xanthomendoza sp. 2 TL-2023]
MLRKLFSLLPSTDRILDTILDIGQNPVGFLCLLISPFYALGNSIILLSLLYCYGSVPRKPWAPCPSDDDAISEAASRACTACQEERSQIFILGTILTGLLTCIWTIAFLVIKLHHRHLEREKTTPPRTHKKTPQNPTKKQNTDSAASTAWTTALRHPNPNLNPPPRLNADNDNENQTNHPSTTTIITIPPSHLTRSITITTASSITHHGRTIALPEPRFKFSDPPWRQTAAGGNVRCIRWGGDEGLEGRVYDPYL